MDDEARVAENLAGDAPTQRAALTRVLERVPDAHVVAIGPDAIFTDMPEDMPLGPGHRVLDGRSVVDLVTRDSLQVVIDAWDTVRTGAPARCDVRLRAEPSTDVRIEWFDARAAFEVYLAVLTPIGFGAAHEALELDSMVPVRPRLGRMTKNGSALITGADDAALRMLGLTEDEIIGQRSLDLIHPADQALAIDSWFDMLACPGESRRVRLRHRQGDGSYRWVEITNDNQLGPAADGVITAELLDVSDEMAALEALRAREELLNRLAQALPLGIVQFDAHRRIVYGNARMAEITGAAQAPDLDEQMALVSAADTGALTDAIDGVLRSGEATDLDVRFDLPAGPRIGNVRLEALREADGRVSGGIMCVNDITESATLREELRVRATYDALTGCHNRASTMARFEELLQRAGGGLGLVFIDLDHFKTVNDTHGHAAGDAVLVSVAARVRDAVRPGDLVGRLGGDEFVVLAPGSSSPHVTDELAERVRLALRHRVVVGDEVIDVSATTGTAWTDDPDASPDTLVAVADGAMYEAKRRRRDAPSPVERRRRDDEPAGSHRVPAVDELELCFQPVVELPSQRVWGAEALLRWRRDGGRVPASLFIDAAEQPGAVIELGRWVVEELAARIGAARSAGLDGLTWFMNLSPAELADDGRGRVVDALRRHGVPGASVVIEVSERAGLAAEPTALAAARELADRGIGIGLDDVGTGDASIVTLHELPLQWIKVDPVVATRANGSGRAPSLLASFQRVAQALGLGLIVENVETDAHLAEVAALDVRLAQGRLFHDALPFDDLVELVRTGRPPAGPTPSPSTVGQATAPLRADVGANGSAAVHDGARGER